MENDKRWKLLFLFLFYSSSQQVMQKMKFRATGNIDYLINHDQLLIQTTPQGNSILHVYIITSTKKISNSSTQTQIQTQTQTQKSTIEKILQKYPELLTKPNIKGETPLQLAARFGNREIVESLIQINKEADLESGRERLKQMLRTVNADKDTALHEAARGNYPEIVRILSVEDGDGTSYLANDAGETPLYIATERGHYDVVQQILDNCESPGVKGPLGRTVLHAAVIHNHKAITEKIVEKIGATLAKQVDYQGWTALHYAAYFGHVEMVRLLLKFDRSMTYESNNSDKLTALHIAARRGKNQVIKDMLKICPDCIEQVDCKGWNALHFAAEKGHEGTINLILNTSPLCNNLVNERDQEGNTILHHLATSLLTRFLTRFVVQMPSLHSIIDKRAYNKQNQTALDVILVHAKLMQSTNINDQTIFMQRNNAILLNKYGVPPGLRILHDEKVWKREFKYEESNLMRASAGHLVVAALIATVTFAAGFTLPGGYKGGDGLDAGEAVLIKKPAFKVFIVTNTLALVLSISAVFNHLFLLLKRKHQVMTCLLTFAFLLTIAAMGLMGVAFITGMYAVLEQSSGLAIATCVLGVLFFILYSCYALPQLSRGARRSWRAYAKGGIPWYKIPYKLCCCCCCR